MKKYILLSMILCGAAAIAQQQPAKSYNYTLPENLNLAVKQMAESSDSPFAIGFSMNGNRYRSIFQHYDLTTNRDNYGLNTIYVGHDNKLYYDGYRPIIISMPGAGIDLNNINYNCGVPPVQVAAVTFRKQ